MTEIPELKALLNTLETVINEKQVSPETLARLSDGYQTYRDAVFFEDKLKGGVGCVKPWLTNREAIVLRLRVAEGKAFAEIAVELEISETTVKHHVAKALRTLRHHDKRESVLQVVESFATKQVKEKFKLLLWG